MIARFFFFFSLSLLSPLGLESGTSHKPAPNPLLLDPRLRGIVKLTHYICICLILFFSLLFSFPFDILKYSQKCAFGHAASKEDLIPPVPILTRYKKEAGIKAFVKKELMDPRLPDERRSSEINVQTTPTLCVQLNTLYVSTRL